ncbi:MAG: hypothetical protein O7J95_08145 [Planctomycetota bacterium]|nr:hypothetical protein [Planctomycetota bacterium]
MFASGAKPAPLSEGDAPVEEAAPREREGELERQIGALEMTSKRLTRLRLGTFAAMAVGVLGAGTSVLVPVLLAVPGLGLFVWAVLRHGSVLDRKSLLENRLLLAREERERRTSRRRARSLPSPPPPGATALGRGERVYASEPESYVLDAQVAADLDLLRGPRSVFGLLDVSSTSLGARRLEHLLRRPLRSVPDIRERQAAVRALADDDGIRSALLEALIDLRRDSLEGLPSSLHEPTVFAGRRGVALLAHVLGTAAPLLLVASFFHLAFLPFLFLAGVVNMAVVGCYVKKSNPARGRLLSFAPLLGGLLRLEQVLGPSTLASATWGEVRELLRRLRPAVERLRRRIGLLEWHDFGILFEILNILTLWELRILPVAESIFRRERFDLEKAMGALGDTEALLSLSSALAEQKGFVLPEPLEEERPSIEVEELGHPLLDPDSLVRNPLAVGVGCNVAIVTGSNMAGKSTYLKSLGANVVLAGAGGPVCAASFRWTPLMLATDINIRDSLDDGKSYFQVEVERVLEVIRASRETPRILAIFDELFRGTNAEERLAISRGLLRHLRSRGILVLLATHDGKLTRLVTEDKEPGMQNFHFREQVDGTSMTFDYRLREGPAPTRNAVRILEASGYPDEVTREALEGSE